MSNIQTSSWFILAGVAAILGGVTLAITTGDSNVPNDPNIGASLVLLLGIVAGASGLLMRWLDRR